MTAQPAKYPPASTGQEASSIPAPSEGGQKAQLTLIKESVEGFGGGAREKFLQRLFTVWFGGFVYNQIWEDPEIDAEALNLGAAHRILTISSGGCNILNYLTFLPQSVTAVDVNPCHIALARLKVAALTYLPRYEDFFAFFGTGGDQKNRERYLTYLRPHLDEGTRRFWEGGFLTRVTGTSRLRYFQKNIYDYSRSGLFLRFVSQLSRWNGCELSEILRAKSLKEQRAFYDKYLDPVFSSRVVQFLSNLPITVYSLGVPPQQFDEMLAGEQRQMSVADMYRERVRRLSCDFPIRTNYFAWQAFSRRYNIADQDALPLYLRADNYDELKANTHRVRIVHTTLTSHLRQQRVGSIDRFVFLDSQDWMNPAMLTELWSEVLRVAPAGSRIIFRTASSESPLPQKLPAELMRRLTYFEEESKAYFKRDRSAIYGGFHLYEVN